jgi:hypothetical protein
MTDLEARVKALEDLVQKITQAFVAPPTPIVPHYTSTSTTTTTSGTSPETSDLEYSKAEDGNTLIYPKHHLTLERFKEVTAKVKADGGKYVIATSDTPGHWSVPQ